MSARKMKAAHVEAALTLADCVVRAARGYERADGGIAFSGNLFVRDVPVATFSNDGNGGATMFKVKVPALFAEFKNFAKASRPDFNFEHAENLVGELWDAAVMRSGT